MRILIVDDENSILEMLDNIINGILDVEITTCTNGEEALELFKKNPYPLVFSDIKMPKMNGIKLLKKIKSIDEGKNTTFVLFTGFGEMASAIQAIKMGASDYLFKPLEINKIIEIIKNKILTLSDSEEPKEKDYIQEKKKFLYPYLINGAYLLLPDGLKIGVFSEKLRSVVELALKYHIDKDVSVLIQGESGTGKEIISRLVHFGENGLEEPYNSINCSSISPSLFESELFGYEGGAYTGSKSVGMSGKLELAGAGTVLFDEIGDLPLELQPKLLKVIEERRFYRVGGLKEISLEARIIAATNRDLKVMISQGSFRKDLYHRLNTGCINIPSLREQRESIIPLAQMFLNEFSRRRRRLFKFIGKSAAELLQSCQWNGNIRELRNLIDRVTLLFNEVELQPAHLDSAEFYSSSDSVNNIPILKIGGFELPDEGLNLQNLESEIVRKVLEKFNGNKSKTAAYLGLTVSSLRSRL